VGRFTLPVHSNSESIRMRSESPSACRKGKGSRPAHFAHHCYAHEICTLIAQERISYMDIADRGRAAAALRDDRTGVGTARDPAAASGAAMASSATKAFLTMLRPSRRGFES
jgi:hypothetical protein